MWLTSSITQVTHTSRASTPETAATRATVRSRTSKTLTSFTDGRRKNNQYGNDLYSSNNSDPVEPQLVWEVNRNV
jgi:hypothetical protein